MALAIGIMPDFSRVSLAGNRDPDGGGGEARVRRGYNSYL
jgi:hypothetical protein